MTRPTTGVDEHGRLAYEVFARNLFTGGAELLASTGVHRRGPLRRTEPDTWAARGMLRYAQCKRAVAPPTGWDGSLAQRSLTLPAARLELEHVYAGAGEGGALFCVGDGRVAYFAAALGLVYDTEAAAGGGGGGSQRFFCEHGARVSAMALHPNGDTLATAERGAVPRVLFWSASSCESVAECAPLLLPRGMDRVLAWMLPRHRN